MSNQDLTRVVAEFASSPTALLPDALRELLALVENGALAPQAPAGGIGDPATAPRMHDGGIAVVEVSGILFAKPGPLQALVGGTAASRIQSLIERLRRDAVVKAVVVDVDSPGGQVFGVPALAASLRALADAKPTVAVCTGVCASAAYWVACAARSVYVSGVTDLMGSIGVTATHQYSPPRDGQVLTAVAAGSHKLHGSPLLPLTAGGQAMLRARVASIYGEFVAAVALNRGVAVEVALDTMANGRLFVGRDAIAAGLADGVARVDQIVDRLRHEPQAFVRRQSRRAAPAARRSAAAAAPARSVVAPLPPTRAAAPLPPAQTRADAITSARALAHAIAGVQHDELLNRGRIVHPSAALRRLLPSTAQQPSAPSLLNPANRQP